MAKITGKEGLGFKGKARTFDTEDDFVKAVESGSIKKGEKTVVILRYLGPKGGPGKLVPIYTYHQPDSLSRYAGDVETDQLDHGCWFRTRCGLSN